ncbi:hypothetical protein AB0E63_25715 [Kribbella sp. NPDC026596]|uniref:hypothetical protein n=1 Tax=Kribbella sp. NPDC026596 TaxID=3155122 RepID=UPI0033D78F45
MDERSLAVTRRSLHGVAELVLAGPQYHQGGGIRLRVVTGGFATVVSPGLRVDGDRLVAPSGSIPLTGSYADLAAAAGVEASRLDDVYSGGPKISPDDELEVDPSAARLLADAFAKGEDALRVLAPQQTPVLWPEHFDVGISVGEVNYGVSPGDDAIPEPYAYVGPWTPQTGSFWNVPFGAAQPIAALDDASAVVQFFRAGRDAVR